MTALVRAVLASALVLTAMVDAALAHPPPLGLTGFSGGVLHPMVVPAHLMAVVALGLLIGQQGPRWGSAAAAAYGLGLVAGLGAIALAYVPQFANETLLALALILGGLVALAHPLPVAVGCALATGTGLALGLDSPPEAIALWEANRMLIGTGIGAAVLLIVVLGAALQLTRDWQCVGVRIVGSWIAASAILVLTLQLAR